MIRQYVEKRMELHEGEQHFSPEVSNALFGLGFKAPNISEKILGATVRTEQPDDTYRILVEVERTSGRFKNLIGHGYVPTTAVKGERPTELLGQLNDSATLGRANRVLDRSSRIYDTLVLFGALGVITVNAVAHSI